jgi:hypothetical protein
VALNAGTPASKSIPVVLSPSPALAAVVPRMLEDARTG